MSLQSLFPLNSMNPQSSILNFFDKSYVINLPERQDRLRGIEHELKRLRGSHSSDKVKIFSAIKPTDQGEFPSIGARGCFLSHLAILKEAHAQNLRNLLIMEDDLSFSKFLIEHKESIAQELETLDWNFIYFGHTKSIVSDQKKVFHEFNEPIEFTHFLAINGTIFEPLIHFLEQVLERPGGHPDGGPMHVDGAYSTFRAQNSRVITLLASPSLGFQRSSPSNIAGYKWFDRLPVLSQFLGTARTVKNFYRRNVER
jgi:glycosyl transferase, family 25